MLTREFRRAVCFHEAGHAVIYALGGSFIHGLAVAPAGSESWTYQGRKGRVHEDLWGICEPSDSPLVSMHLDWDDRQLCYRTNRDEFNRMHRSIAMSLGAMRGKQFLANVRRCVRGGVCAALAGPIGELYHEQGEFNVWDADGWTFPESDVEVAMGLAQLLPYRSEFEHACEVACEALRRPEIWTRVVALADELERTGNMCPDAVAKFLPRPKLEWPPSVVARRGGHRQ
ncbi:hypothetical protein PQR37_13210 [Paraburkholderia nemoris]|uniref:hypothetical protein n=1 Tax=Paraburkholderia nemoris TaxID=2793076 RepID=UPI0038BBE833